jgi:hypothetical protein
MVRFEVSSSAAIASAVSGLRVRRSTWMIWNSRSARLIERLFFFFGGVSFLAARHPMLTACWQQGVSITGQRFEHEDFVDDDSVWPRLVDHNIAAADTTVAAGGG